MTEIGARLHSYDLNLSYGVLFGVLGVLHIFAHAIIVLYENTLLLFPNRDC